MITTKNAEIIIGEGITELYYFRSIKDFIVIRPEPKIVKPYNMDELDRAIKQYATQGATKIHCLIDMDNKVNNRVTRDKYQQLKQKYNGKLVPRTDCEVHFYESFPSVELFFYYYFEFSSAEKSNDGLKSWLKHKCGYDTTEKYLSKPSLHNRLIRHGGCLKYAIQNAKQSVRLRQANNYNCSYTEIGELFEYLGLR